MSVGILIYLATFYWVVAKTSLALASFIGSLMMVLPFMNVFNETNQSVSSLVFVGTWLITSWAVGMHGLVITLGSMLVSFIYILLEIEFDFSNLRPIGLLLIIGAVTVALFSYFFWRNKFITEASERVDKLSGMLRTHKQQSEILIQSITDGIIVIDTDCKITLINGSATKLTAWPEKEATGFDARNVFKLIKDPKTNEITPDSEHPFNKVLSTHEPVSGTMQLRSRDNKDRFISLTISPVIAPKTTELAGAVAVFRRQT